MSIKIGKAAEEQAFAEKKDYSKVLAKFKSGSVYRVKIPNGETFAQYDAHGVFGSFYTTLHEEGDLYCKAASYYYDLAGKEKDEKKAEELKQKGYSLKKKERYMLGFFDLSTGAEIVIDVTKAQAVALIKQVKKYQGKYEKFSFSLEKSGTGQSTTVSLDPIIDEDDLTSQERKNFEAALTREFDLDVFVNIFQTRNHEEQIEDLKKFGMTAAELKVIGVGATSEVDIPQEEKEQQFDF